MNNDPHKTALSIEKKIALLEQGRGLLEGLGNDKALMTAIYDKDLAIALIKLRNGKDFMLEGEAIKDPPAGLCEKIAKGICWESRLRMEQADITYKSAITKMDSIRSELNGCQSVNRHLSDLS
jgi:hypothetical protein